ncbi:MAG: penicillin acylase family protein, partial [Polyangiaceae bacterium]|nr:penicillin acylase family protein [Polyangiaceae bacterium]
DRSAQLEFLRRAARGRLAEAFGAHARAFVDQDIVMRTFGLTQLAEDKLASMDAQAPSRLWIEAFADGASQAFQRIRVGEMEPAGALEGLERRHFESFTAVDVLAIDRFYELAGSVTLHQELAVERILRSMPSAFPPSSDDPAVAARAGALPDLLRFAPPVAARSTDKPGVRSATSAGFAAPTPSADLSLLPARYGEVVDAFEQLRALAGHSSSGGSNAWAVAPLRSAFGTTLFASDPHLHLSSPSQLWLVHLEIVSDNPNLAMSAAGATRMGVPWIAFGFNQHTAWGATAAYHDVADLYTEQISGGGLAVKFRGSDVPVEVREELILDAGGDAVSLRVRTVPHHGPMLPEISGHVPIEPRDGAFALSVRWAGALSFWAPERSLAIMRATTVESALASARDFPSSSRGFVLAGDDGDIAFVDAAAVPLRDPRAVAWDPSLYLGLLPCRVLPSDGSAEWQGWLDPHLAPSSRNPATGLVAAANADPTGATFDNHPGNEIFGDGTPAYLGCAFDAGFRLARIQGRLLEPGRLWSAELMADIQADVHSSLGARLAKHLVAAMRRGLKELDQPGTFPALTGVVSSSRFASAGIPAWIELLDAWEAYTDFRASAGVKFADMLPTSDEYDAIASRATLAFNTWFVRVLDLLFDDELARLGTGVLADEALVRSLLHLLETEPASLASYSAPARDSVLWDDLNTPEIESRDERMLVAFLDAIDWMALRLGDARDDWRWGRLHTVRLQPLGGVLGKFAVPDASDTTFPNGFPRAGDLFAVDAAPYDATPSSFSELSYQYEEGAAQRLVVELGRDDGVAAWGALAGGQQAVSSGAHFRDEMEYWRHNQSHAWAVRRGDVIAAAQRREVASDQTAESTLATH